MSSNNRGPSIRSSAPDFDRSPRRQHTQRFQSLDADHISALEQVWNEHPFLRARIEVHLPSNRAKSALTRDVMWVWPKFDRRPASYLVFIDGFAPCIWDPSRQEGQTLRWLLPPGFSSRGPIVMIANMLKGESILQIEDLLVISGQDLWSTRTFSARWEELRRIWKQIPVHQPLLAIEPRIVRPVPLEQWEEVYDSSLSWIIQPDCQKAPRWFWWDNVTKVERRPFVAPALQRATEVCVQTSARLVPYDKLGLPDTYMLIAQGGEQIGVASVRSFALSKEIREKIGSGTTESLVVAVEWCEDFEKYGVIRILDADDTVVSPISFFPKAGGCSAIKH